jgi:hypothetical protein
MPNDLSSLLGGSYGDMLSQGRAPRAAGAPMQGPLSGLLQAYNASMAARPQQAAPVGPPGAMPMAPQGPPGAMPGVQLGPQGVQAQVPIPGGPPGLMAQGQMGIPRLGGGMPPMGGGLAYGRRF